MAAPGPVPGKKGVVERKAGEKRVKEEERKEKEGGSKRVGVRWKGPGPALLSTNCPSVPAYLKLDPASGSLHILL